MVINVTVNEEVVAVRSPEEQVEVSLPEQSKSNGEGINLQTIINEVINRVASELPQGRLSNVTILANKWVGTTSPFSQVVTVDGVTENTQVDLTPSVEQLAIFHQKDLAFVTENENGVVTVYAIGQKPEHDYTIQVTMTEVLV